ncbi:MAG: hypothetical protein D6680_08705 [Cyanobacteria bacterium J007]|nr:MAG: hypothetical protein D6680_08705 [Cyanobacteria bacterium J007]
MVENSVLCNYSPFTGSGHTIAIAPRRSPGEKTVFLVKIAGIFRFYVYFRHFPVLNPAIAHLNRDRLWRSAKDRES